MVCGLGVLLVDRRARLRPAPTAAGGAAPAGHAERPGQHPATTPLALPVFVGTALLFLRLLANEHLDKFAVLGRPTRSGADPAHWRVLWQVSIVAVRRRPAGRAARPGHRPARPHRRRRRRRRRRRQRLPAHHGQPVHPAAARPGRADAHPAGLRRDRGAVDVATCAPPCSTSSRDDEWRPSPRDLPSDNTRRRRLPQPTRAWRPGVGGADGRLEARSSRPTSAPPGCRSPTRSASSTSTGGWRYDSRTLDVALRRWVGRRRS